jgi:hypothetical protein
MGCFSFKTLDTQESIPSTMSTRDTFTVYMVDNQNNVWEEKEYEGYGVFGGKDFYELLAEMNGKKTRDEGIDIYFYGGDFLCPNLFRNKDQVWRNEKVEDCEYQGFFYPDERGDRYNEFDSEEESDYKYDEWN